jgi:hypothetical protein
MTPAFCAIGLPVVRVILSLSADLLTEQTEKCGHREHRIHLLRYAGCCWASVGWSKRHAKPVHVLDDG